MPIQCNVFVRGYRHLAIQRMLLVSESGSGTQYRLHPHETEADYTDEAFVGQSCIINDTHALLEPEELTEELETEFPSEGRIESVVFCIVSNDDAAGTVIGYVDDERTARALVENISYSTGTFSRCWEISTAHLPVSARQFLEDLAKAIPPGVPHFETIQLPASNAVGCKLSATPWSDENLATHGLTTKTLRERQLRAGAPAVLLDVLHLAAGADTRILIFDPNAEVLQGLQVFDD